MISRKTRAPGAAAVPPLCYPLATAQAVIYSGADRLSLSFSYPLAPRGAAGWVVVPRLGPAAPAQAALLRRLHNLGLATLAVDVAGRDAGFAVAAWSARLLAALRWLQRQPMARDLRLGLLAAGPAAAAALNAAAELGPGVAAVVALGGRPDLAAKQLPAVQAATLLVAGRGDPVVLAANRAAAARLNDRSQLVLAPSWRYLRRRLTTPGALDDLLAVEWLGRHVAGLAPAELPREPLTARLPALRRHGQAAAAATVLALLATALRPARPAAAVSTLDRDTVTGTLTYTGSNAGSTLTVLKSAPAGGLYQITDPSEGVIGLDADAINAGCIYLGGILWNVACPEAAVGSLVINTNDGNDLVALVLRDGFAPTTVNGGNNSDLLLIDDTLTTGYNDGYSISATTFNRTGVSSITYSGLEGFRVNAETTHNNISVVGLPTASTLDGGDGNDGLSLGSGLLDNFNGDLTVYGGAGTDTLSVNDSSSATPLFFDGAAIKRGSLDITLGESGGAVINAVSIQSGSADDTLNASGFAHGPVTLVAGNGADTLFGTTSSDNLNGGGGLSDRLVAAGDNYWDLDNTVIYGAGHGTDTLAGIEEASITAGNSDNTVWADQFTIGPVTILGLGGNDWLSGGSFSDNVQGGDGNDTLLGFGGNDTLNGGNHTVGDVLLEMNSTGSLTLTNSSLVSSLGSDFLSGIEQASLAAGGGNDVMDAASFTAGPVSLDGQGGNDTIWSGSSTSNDSIIGNTGDDWVAAAGDLNWTLGDVNPGLGTATLAGVNRGTDNLNGIDHASLTGGSGNNTIDASTFGLGGVVLSGLSGTDTIRGGLGNDTLSGGGQNDDIDGRPGTDLLLEVGNGNFTLSDTALTGVMGSDTLDNIEEASLTGGLSNNVFDLSGFRGAATLAGQAGADQLVISRAGEGPAISFSLTTTSLTQSGRGAIAHTSLEQVSLAGGNGSDTINAAAFNGQVTLSGNDGNDIISGGSANDSLDGNGGADTVAATADGNLFLGASVLTGTVGIGSDNISGLEFASLSGGGSANVIDASGFAGDAYLFGASGNDTLTGGDGDDTLDGGDNTDTAVLKAGNASITLSGSSFSGQGNDVLLNIESYGVLGSVLGQTFDASTFLYSVLLDGAGGNDTLIGSNQADTIIGGAGDDTLTGNSGSDHLYGDNLTPGVTGNDRLVESFDSNMVLTNSGLTIGANVDTLTSLEEASLTGGGSANALNAGAFSAGSVTLVGLGGNDTLTAPANSSSLAGGNETDLAILSYDGSFTLSDTGAVGPINYQFSEVDQVSLTAGGSANNLDAAAFTRGPVTLLGAGGNDTLRGTALSDLLDGGSGADRLLASGDVNFTLSNSGLSGLGNDALAGFEAASLVGGPGGNLITAAAFTGTTTLEGQGGNDALIGTLAADSLKGGADNDSLTGGLGADTLDGEAGADRLVEQGDVDFVLTDNSLAGLGGDQLAGFESASLVGTAAVSANSLDAGGFTLGPVTLGGGGGNDTLAGSPGNDSLDGGADNDSAVYYVGNANVTLSGNSIQGAGNDTLTSIEFFAVRGGAGPNLFDASAFNGAVTLQGGGGNDTLIGGPLADLLMGEANQDFLTGNGGNDTLDGGPGTDEIVAEGDFGLFTLTDNLLTADGADSLIAVDAARLTGGSGVNAFNTTAFSKTVYLDGGDADDLFTLGTAGGVITGGLGSHDILSLTADMNLTLSDTALQAAGQFLLDGVEGASLTGGASANQFNASSFSGAATLVGLGANDTLIGGSGPDAISGGPGDDTLTGNQGADDLQGEGGAADRWLELADFDITLVAEGLLGEVIDTVSGIESAQITGTDVNNRFNLAGFSGVATLDGGLGSDSLAGGSGADLLQGKAGADTLVGSAANDTLDGGAETDQLFASGALTFTLSTTRLEGLGRDTLVSLEEAHLVGSAADNIYDASAFGSLITDVGQVTLEGDAGNDTLIGGVKADSLTGDQGNDSLVGNDGADTLTGGDAAPGANTNDTLVGGAGADLLDGVFGDDVLQGGADSDILVGASGNDLMDGGPGDDFLSAAFDDDTAVGAPGLDTLTGGPGADTLQGGLGLDRVTEFADVNFSYETGTLHSGANGDDLLTDIEEASLTGGSSPNLFDLTSFPGPVSLSGLAGNDTFTGSANNDIIDGGANTDRVTDQNNADWLLTDTSLVGRGSDTLVSLEEAGLTGGPSGNHLNAFAFTGNTTLTGGPGDDTLVGGYGSDSLLGGAENDTFTGSLGDDTILGNAGDNALTEVVTATTGVTLTLTNNSLLGLGTDVLSNTLRVTLQGGIGDDLFLATAFTGTATLAGDQGNDTFHGGQGNDSLNGGGGADRVDETADQHYLLSDTSLVVSNTIQVLSTDALASIEAASLTGGAGANSIDASAFSGPTSLTGLGGNDRLLGGANSDSLLGGAGLDTLTGGLGNDTLDGGDETDRLQETADVALLKLQNVVLTGLGTDELRSLETANLSGGPGVNTLDASAFTGSVTLIGDAGNDVLIGGSAADELNGGDGADTLTGNGGSDIVFGGSGAFEDTLLETSTVPSVLLTSANLVAGATDFLNGVEAATITGGSANQTMDASAFSGRVRFDGAGGNDSLLGTINADTLLGGPGLDTLRGGLGNDQLDGGPDLDRLVETSDANLALTNAGLVITQGVTILNSDVISGFEQASLTGGLGANILASSMFTGTATLIGSNSDDVLVGGSQKDSLVGGLGSDTLTGGDGDDTLLGGPGDVDRVAETGDVNFALTPTLLTGLGADSLDSLEEASLTGGASANLLDTTAFPGPVSLDGVAGNDTLLSAAGNDRLTGGPDDDVLTAGLGADTILGEAGSDRLVEGGDVSFTLTETSLTGLGGDSLTGLEAASLTGGAGNNTFNLLDWAHPSTLNAGAGTDALTLSGSNAADNFSLTPTSVTFGPVTDVFNDLETLTLAGLDGDDVFDLTNLAAAATDGQAGVTLTLINLLGGNGDDLFELAPYPTLALNVDGGPNGPGDTLNFHAGGLYVPPEVGRLTAEGRQPVSYTNIEHLNIFERLLRLFLPIAIK
ncbi:MAG: hypothetical protein IT317_09765 [Anaerolineales bacterium]|nr:hypothetical protein [Anaerolineales bacterium]